MTVRSSSDASVASKSTSVFTSQSKRITVSSVARAGYRRATEIATSLQAAAFKNQNSRAVRRIKRKARKSKRLIRVL